MSVNSPTLPGFDYSILAPDIRSTVETATRRLHELERRTSESIIEMGQHLIAVKASLPHGQFLPWLEREFGWSRMTANRLMEVADAFGQMSQIVTSASPSPSALYLLAAPSTPESVRVEFTELMEAGRQVRHQDVQTAIAERKAPRRAEPILVDDWDNDDEPEEVPYEVVDTRTGEIVPPMSRNHSMSFMPSPPPPTAHIPTTQQQATRIAADLLERHGAGLAIQIADAIYAQCGGNRGAA